MLLDLLLSYRIAHPYGGMVPAVKKKPGKWVASSSGGADTDPRRSCQKVASSSEASAEHLNRESKPQGSRLSRKRYSHKESESETPLPLHRSVSPEEFKPAFRKLLKRSLESSERSPRSTKQRESLPWRIDSDSKRSDQGLSDDVWNDTSSRDIGWYHGGLKDFDGKVQEQADVNRPKASATLQRVSGAVPVRLQDASRSRQGPSVPVQQHAKPELMHVLSSEEQAASSREEAKVSWPTMLLPVQNQLGGVVSRRPRPPTKSQQEASELLPRPVAMQQDATSSDFPPKPAPMQQAAVSSSRMICLEAPTPMQEEEYIMVDGVGVLTSGMSPRDVQELSTLAASSLNPENVLDFGLELPVIIPEPPNDEGAWVFLRTWVEPGCNVQKRVRIWRQDLAIEGPVVVPPGFVRWKTQQQQLSVAGTSLH